MGHVPDLRSASRVGAAGSISAVDVWWDYRRVWAAHPWLLVYAVIVVLVLVLAVVGTVVRSPLAILFIPALGGAYAHHIMAMRRLDR